MFHKITDPNTNKTFSIFSKDGKQLLKQYIKLFQNGGALNNPYLTCLEECDYDQRPLIDGDKKK